MKTRFKSVVSVVLSLMMIISMVSVGFITTNAATTAKIYFDNSSSNWSSVTIWAWDSSTNYTGGSWPGLAMTNEGNNIWSYDLDTNAKYVIFSNNGASQTSDITLPSDWTTKEKVLNSDGSSYNKDGSEDAPDISAGERIYFDNSVSGWSSLYIYLWKSSNGNSDTNNENFGSGSDSTTLMTQIDGSDIWYYEFNNNYSGSIIFRASNSNWDLQTNNIALSARGSNNCVKPTATGTKPTTEWTTYSEDPGPVLTPGEITLKDSTSINGSLSFSVIGKTAGTADTGDAATITAKPFDGFTCSGITASYTDASGTAVETPLTVSDNTVAFDVPDVQANADGEKEISFEATFTLNKESYLASKGEGLWIDVAPDQNDTTATLIKWNNYFSYNHDTATNPYTFYVPKNVDLTNAKIYNGYSTSVTINNASISSGTFGTVNLSVDATGSKTYNVTGAYSGNLKVMQGSTNAMFLYTTKKGAETALRTQTYKGWDDNNSGATKNDEKTDGGSCVTMTNTTTTAEFSNAMSLESVKGRGNSSWEASARRFGKYAYNMKLSDKTTLFGMATDTKKSAGSKSWCLLANNADESMLRNALAYELADDVGLYSSPEFSFVDIYDNGEYLGQYLVTEKVDVGTSKLVYGESIEDINEDAGLIFDEDSKNVVNNASFTANGKTYNYSYCYTTETTGAASPDISKATYLLEFEIEERYTAEACWFTTPKGQHVVIKSPEFATETQVKYIAEKFIEMEDAVFTDSNTNSELSKYIDLDSFARMYLIQEISSNLDAASTSYYVTYDCSKGSNARFVASPVWDYDWAFGQYSGTGKYDVSGNALHPQATNEWYAKNKKYGDSSYDLANNYSIQSKLANNSEFQQVIKKVWNGTDTQEGFYAKVQKYYGDNSKIDSWCSQISASVNMNETRWRFIANNNISDWGSGNTGDTHTDAVSYLENTFLSARASWLDTQFASYPDYSQIAAPTLTAYTADGNELTGEVTAGDSIVLKAETTEIFVEYKLYKDGTYTGDYNTTGEFTVNAEKGTSAYTVKTVYNNTDEQTSDAVTVTASEDQTITLTGVTLAANASEITKGNSIRLTATPAPVGITGTTYTFYSSADGTISDGDTVIASSSNTATVTPSEIGTYYYYVVAENNGVTKTSEVISVTVTESVGTHTVKVWFKSSSGNVYVPSVSLDGGSYTIMTRIKKGETGSTYIGATYSGSLKFYWYYADIEIDSSTTHTLTFRTAGTSVRATSEQSSFSGGEYYFAVDNLVQDTTLVDLTGMDEYIRNYHRTATHMVYNTLIDGDSSLGFTFIDGKEYAMGQMVDGTAQQSSLEDTILTSQLGKLAVPSASSVGAGYAPFTIDSATLAQKFAADLEDLSELQWCLLDVNLDGHVDVLDATFMQKALVQ